MIYSNSFDLDGVEIREGLYNTLINVSQHSNFSLIPFSETLDNNLGYFTIMNIKVSHLSSRINSIFTPRVLRHATGCCFGELIQVVDRLFVFLSKVESVKRRETSQASRLSDLGLDHRMGHPIYIR